VSGEHVIYDRGNWRITYAAVLIAAVFILSGLVLTACFVLLLRPADDRVEQAAIALATAVVTAWITAVSSRVVQAHIRSDEAETSSR